MRLFGARGESEASEMADNVRDERATEMGGAASGEAGRTVHFIREIIRSDPRSGSARP